ncbi:MAG: hypothetical protein HUK40_01265 [Desulfobacter sp.]|nr:hypothetical protein [Desulfobacter sp.]
MFFMVSLAAVPWLVGKIPTYHFVDVSQDRGPGKLKKGSLAVRAVKNLGGLVLILAGIIMLFIPGQGLLTILVGVIFLEFPKKKRLILFLVGNKQIQQGLNWIRDKKKVPTLKFP